MTPQLKKAYIRVKLGGRRTTTLNEKQGAIYCGFIVPGESEGGGNSVGITTPLEKTNNNESIIFKLKKMEKNKTDIPHNKGEKKGVYLDLIRYNEYQGKRLNRCAAKMAHFITENNLLLSHNLSEILLQANSLQSQIKILQTIIKSSICQHG